MDLNGVTPQSGSAPRLAMLRVPSVHRLSHSAEADKRADDPGCTADGPCARESTGRCQIQAADDEVHQQQRDQRHQQPGAVPSDPSLEARGRNCPSIHAAGLPAPANIDAGTVSWEGRRSDVLEAVADPRLRLGCLPAIVRSGRPGTDLPHIPVRGPDKKRVSLSPERLARLKEHRRLEVQPVELAQQRQPLDLGFLWHMPGLPQHWASLALGRTD